jgi:hypothetical protein
VSTSVAKSNSIIEKQKMKEFKFEFEFENKSNRLRKKIKYFNLSF